MNLFSAEGPLMRALSNIVTLLVLNLLTAFCSLPIFTAGAAFSAMHYMIMKMMDGDDGRVPKRYFEQFRTNFKTSTPVWLVLLAIAVFLWFDYRIFLSQNDTPLRVLLIAIWVAAFVLFALFVWIFPVMARFEGGFRGAFRNAFRLSIGSFPRTLAMMALYFAITFVLSQSWKLLPLFFLFGFTAPAYFSALLYYPVIKRMIKRVTGEEEESDDASS